MWKVGSVAVFVRARVGARHSYDPILASGTLVGPHGSPYPTPSGPDRRRLRPAVVSIGLSQPPKGFR